VELRQLEFLIETARRGSINRAAEHLLVGQPVVSRQIKMLEEELHVRLLGRTPVGITLTSVGERVLEKARVVLDLIGEIKSTADSFTQDRILNLGVVPAVMQSERLARVMDLLSQQVHGVRAELQELGAFRILDLLEEQRLDAGVLTWIPALAGIPKSLQIERLKTGSLVVAVSTRNPFFKRKALTLMDLREQSVVMFRKGYVLHDYVNKVFLETFEALPHVAMFSDNTITMRTLIAQNRGVGFFSDFFAPSTEGIRYIPLTGYEQSIDLVFAHRNTPETSRVIRYLSTLLHAML